MERDLAPAALPWNEIFNRVKVICKQNSLREFFYTLIHRIVVTEKELGLYGINTVNLSGRQ